MIECGSTYSKDTYLKSLQKLESFIDAFWRKLNSIKFFFFVWIKSMNIRKEKIPLSHSVDGKISIAFDSKSNSTKIQIAHMFIINFLLMRKERLRFIVFIASGFISFYQYFFHSSMNEIVTKATFDNFESQSILLCLNSILKMRKEENVFFWKLTKMSQLKEYGFNFCKVNQISTQNYRYTKKSILPSHLTWFHFFFK